MEDPQVKFTRGANHGFKDYICPLCGRRYKGYTPGICHQCVRKQARKARMLSDPKTLPFLWN